MQLVLIGLVFLCGIFSQVLAQPCALNCAMLTNNVSCINYQGCKDGGKYSCAWCMSSSTCMDVNYNCPYQNNTLIQCDGEILAIAQCNTPLSPVNYTLMWIIIGVVYGSFVLVIILAIVASVCTCCYRKWRDNRASKYDTIIPV